MSRERVLPAKRRRFLAQLTGVGAAGVAGCMGDNGETRTPNSGEPTSGEPTTGMPTATPGESTPPDTSDLEDRTLLHVDLSDVGSWRTFTTICLQGIANREEPRVYTTGHRIGGIRWAERYEGFPPAKNVWRGWYEQYDHVSVETLPEPTALFDALQRADGSYPFDGYVVVDPGVPDTINLAANDAAIDQLLPVTPGDLEDDAFPDLPVERDLRPGGVREGGFGDMSSVEIYQWAVDHQWPEANHARVGNFTVPSLDAADARDPIDIGEYTDGNDTIHLRFEDSKPGDGFGAQLQILRVLRDGTTVAEVDPGTESEQSSLDNSGSQLNGQGNRFADRGSSWQYAIDGVQGADELSMIVDNHYRVSIATSPDGPWETLVSREDASGEPTTYGTRRELSNFSNYGTRDFLIAEGGFQFHLTSNPSEPDKRALKDEILRSMDEYGYVLGWVSEGESETAHHLPHVSERGKITVGGAQLVPNLSVHSRIDVGDAVARFRDVASGPEEVSAAQDKVYLSFVLSDGDSLNHLFRKAHGGQWLLEERGEIPIGWEMQPLLTELAPAALDYFAATATENDSFVASASSIGYQFPSYMSVGDLDGLLEKTGPYLEETGMTSLSVLSGYKRLSEEKRNLYRDRLGDHLTGSLKGYVRAPGETRLWGTRSASNGTVSTDPTDATAWMPNPHPVTHSPTGGIDGDFDHLQNALTTLAERRPERPLFVPIHLPRSYYPIAEWPELVRGLSDEFEVVSPDDLYAKYAAARAGSIVFAPSEGIVPSAPALGVGPDVTVTAPLLPLGEGPVTAETTIRVRADALEGPATASKRVELEPNRTTDVEYSIDLSGLSGREEVTFEFDVDGETVVSVPATVVDLPGPVQAPNETFASTTAQFGQGDGQYVIAANGEDVGGGNDEYGTIYRAGAFESGDTAVAKVLDQQDLGNHPSKAGLLVRNDLTEPAGSTGYVGAMGMNGGAYLAQWDPDDDGVFSMGAGDGSVSHPYWVRIERDGQTFTMSYRPEGGNWTELTTQKVTSAADVQDVGLFVTSHTADQLNRTVFGEFTVQ